MAQTVEERLYQCYSELLNAGDPRFYFEQMHRIAGDANVNLAECGYTEEVLEEARRTSAIEVARDKLTLLKGPGVWIARNSILDYLAENHLAPADLGITEEELEGMFCQAYHRVIPEYIEEAVRFKAEGKERLFEHSLELLRGAIKYAGLPRFMSLGDRFKLMDWGVADAAGKLIEK